MRESAKGFSLCLRLPKRSVTRFHGVRHVRGQGQEESPMDEGNTEGADPCRQHGLARIEVRLAPAI